MSVKKLTTLKIYNTLTRDLEKFVPIVVNKVGIYVCGNTVYDYCHIGNARVFVFFDVVVRHLENLGYDVNYVRNLTDIDDKIIKKADALNVSHTEITDKFIQALHDDLNALQVTSPTFEPRVTENIDKIIDLIQRLIDRNYAYIASNGDVYYSSMQFADYGKLAQQSLDSLRSGARIEVGDIKRHPLDFVLWKMAKPNEPFWNSPWGNGRPGWHIECSAMSQAFLGDSFDIHGGGIDLQFPHHQNEIAQSEGACDCKFVNYWMHVGFVNANNEKMSKSLGNFFTVRELLAKYNPEVLRLFLLSCHYRSPLGFSLEVLDMTKSSLERLYNALRNLDLSAFDINSMIENIANNQENVVQELWLKFIEAMNDDFNIPLALSYMFDVAHKLNLAKENADSLMELSLQIVNLAACLLAMGRVLGILTQDAEQFFCAGVKDISSEYIQQKIQERQQARQNKDWAMADKIRQELDEIGIVLEDSANGTSWKSKN